MQDVEQETQGAERGARDPGSPAAGGRAGRARRELGALVALAAPLILAQLAQTGMSFVDTLFAGRLGDEALAAIALGGTVFTMTMIVGMGVLFAVSPIASQALGAERPLEAGRTARQGAWLGLAMSVPAVALFWNAEPLLLLAGQPPVAVEPAAGYLRAIAWGFPAAMLLTSFRGLLEAAGATRPILLITLAGLGVNALGNSALVFGRWGLPALGLVGTGVASALVFWTMAVAAAAWILARHPALGLGRGGPRLDGERLRELLAVGVPIALTLAFEAGLFSATAFLMGLFGPLALAAHQIAIQSATTAFMVPVGLSTAVAVRVGRAVGRGDAAAARRAGWTGVAASGAAMLVTAAVFTLAPRLVIGLYVDAGAPERAELVALASTFLAAAGLFQVFDGLQVGAAGALRGYRDTRVPMLLSFVSYWAVGMTAGAVLAFGLGLGGRGLWYGLALGLATAAALLVARLRWRASRPALPVVAAGDPAGGAGEGHGDPAVARPPEVG